MATEGLPTLNSTITIQKKGEAAVTFTADIFNFKEAGINRGIKFTKTIGGIVVPNYSSALSTDISFDFITGDLEVEKLFDTSISGNSVGVFDNFDEYKLVLTFSNGTEYHAKIYYNSILKIYKPAVKKEIIQSSITFSLPMKNINGDSNIYLADSSSEVTANDTTMGY